MTVYNKNDPASIQKMFNSIARQYDKTNAILSFGMHRYWNHTLIRQTIVPSQPKIMLDLCCGTGDIAFGYLKKKKDPLTVYMLDFSEKMLECAKLRGKKHAFIQHDIHYLQADAQVIPLLNNSVDCATIAYGIRNIKDPGLCLKEVYRVLQPGGSFGILELTQPRHPILKYAHSLYLKHLLPLVGKMAASNKEAYEYLCNSIHSFTPPEKLQGLMHGVGFQEIAQYPLLNGVATVLVGKKQ